ncbi:MAG: tetratricopeptide repeat protein [Aquabacterium sp.]
MTRKSLPAAEPATRHRILWDDQRRSRHGDSTAHRGVTAVALGVVLAMALGLAGPPAAAQTTAPVSRTQALQGLTHPDPTRRLAAVQRLGAVGTMADNERLARSLRDADESVREAAEAALWSMWMRSGDKGVDQLAERATALMQAGDLAPALALFSEVIRLRPAFAEGWNKRATVLYLLGRDEESLRDCDEVLRRNPLHFGALGGMAQIHFRQGDAVRALAAYERALDVNPNLDGGREFRELLDKLARAQRAGRT